jgi:anti-sigma factor RsiW
MTMHDMDCTALDERLADYLEGELAPADQRRLESHLASCPRCTALVRDLEQIRIGAAALPELVPSADLWEGVAHRIEAPVVSFAARPAPNVVPRRRFERWTNAAIAAALVAVTAGVTYTLTVARDGNRSGVAAIVNAAPSPARDTGMPAIADVPQRTSAPVPPVAAVANSEAVAPPAEQQPDRSDGRGSAAQRTVGNTSPEVTYSREIDRLRSIFARNRAQLDPRTAAIIEANLKVIDDAIAQSKAALAQDPASRFLNDQLNIALDKKLELLRTAAFLPNRT